MAGITYAESGVDRDAADRLAEKIGRMAGRTRNPRVKSTPGGYASLFELARGKWLAASTDGVGTKLKLAFQTGIHHTVGIDLVAMSVNDLVCVGAEPHFFLDYFATGKLAPRTAERVLEGVVEGCRQARCALVGGETAEMPAMYADGEYDLAGFAVGSLKASEALPRKDIKAGDVLLGFSSSGFHSNGFSLLRKLIDTGRAPADAAERWLEPTRIYVKPLAPLLEARALKGLAHITGSGMLNVPRISEKVSYEITMPAVDETPDVFAWARERSGVALEELYQTFNMGVGMVLAVGPRKADDVLKRLKRSKIPAWRLGEVVPKRRGRASEVVLRDPERSEPIVLS